MRLQIRGKQKPENICGQGVRAVNLPLLSGVTSNAPKPVCGQKTRSCGCEFVANKKTENVYGQGAGTYTSALLVTDQNKETTDVVLGCPS